MNNTQLTSHEAIEVRELVSQEMLGIKKISSTINIVNDSELKTFMQDSIASKKNTIQQIESVITSVIGS